MKTIYVVIVFVSVCLLVVSNIVWQRYKSRNDAADLSSRILQEAEERNARRMSDYEGGDTPQETLSRYIDALENGDYARAVGYFIGEARTREEAVFKKISSDDVARLIGLLRKAERSDGSYSAAKDAYTIREPIFVDFVLYPNGVWKIVEV